MSENDNPSTRRTVLAASACALGGIGLGAVGGMLVSSLQPSESTLAATIDQHRQTVNVSDLAPGQFKQLIAFGMPVILLHRTPEQLASLEKFEGNVADPNSLESTQPSFAQNRFRSRYPELLVVRPLCTHLGCTANYVAAGAVEMEPSWQGGFYCPCHSAKFDLAGRVHKAMPAPINMLVPPHKFLSRNEIQLGHPKDFL